MYRLRMSRGSRKNVMLFCLVGVVMIPLLPFIRNNAKTLVFFLDPGFSYSPPFNTSIKGAPLRVPKKYLDMTGIPRTQFYPATMETWKDFVFATGASADHFEESIDCVASMQNYMPNRTIYFYDLKMKPSQVQRAINLCNVVYKRFEFEKYPPHVGNLKNYAFKPLIIQDAMRYAKGVLWMDSSTRITSSNFEPVYQQLQENGGFLQFLTSKHSIFGVTRPGVYKYIPSNPQGLKKMTQKSAGAILAYNTENVWKNIMKWFYLCSMVHNCINPPNNGPHCNNRLLILVFSKAKKYNTFTGCYRYDQSVLTVLAANHYNFDEGIHYSKQNVLRRWRKGWFPMNLNKIRICGSNKKTKTITANSQ